MSDLTKKFPMTAYGYNKLKEELQNLKNFERPKIIEAIAEARSHGDLSENAEYDAAKERQAFVESRILELEEKITQAQVIEVSSVVGDDIKFGATVTLFNSSNNNEVKYQIVGSDEADIKQGKLSITSPLARALIGKVLGDEVEVATPTGLNYYAVKKIEYL